LWILPFHTELGHDLFHGVAGLVYKPITGYKREGGKGLTKGLVQGVGGLLAMY
jgi:hypothetical protein